MIKKTFRISNRLGLHARPATLLTQLASKYESSILLVKDNQEINCKSILGIMIIAVSYGDEVDVIVDGPDEKEAFLRIEELFTRNDKFNKE